MFSVFPAPLRATLKARDYSEACAIRYAIEGKSMSKQTFHIIDKIVEVDAVLVEDAALCKRLTEVHPEVSFALWNDGQALSTARRHGRAAVCLGACFRSEMAHNTGELAGRL
jgi:predicted RNase H-like nuclease